MTPVLIMLATGYVMLAAIVLTINLAILIADRDNTPRQAVIMFIIICIASLLWPLTIGAYVGYSLYCNKW